MYWRFLQSFGEILALLFCWLERHHYLVTNAIWRARELGFNQFHCNVSHSEYPCDGITLAFPPSTHAALDYRISVIFVCTWYLLHWRSEGFMDADLFAEFYRSYGSTISVLPFLWTFDLFLCRTRSCWPSRFSVRRWTRCLQRRTRVRFKSRFSSRARVSTRRLLDAIFQFAKQCSSTFVKMLNLLWRGLPGGIHPHITSCKLSVHITELREVCCAITLEPRDRESVPNVTVFCAHALMLRRRKQIVAFATIAVNWRHVCHSHLQFVSNN